MNTHLGRARGWLALACILPFAATAAATNFWFSPNGTGDGSLEDRPRRYTPRFMQWVVLHGGRGQVRDVAIHFLPGEYLVEPLGTSTTQPSDWRIRIVGLGKHPEDVVLKLSPGVPEGMSDRGGNWVDVINLIRNSEYLQRFEMENLTVDGNWTGQGEYSTPSYLRAYKNTPVSVSARTGRIRRVIVRNFGAHGTMPLRTNDHSAGVEVFPIQINTVDEGQRPEDGDPFPWMVEDCEIAGFHQLYGGYTSCLMASVRLGTTNTPAWAARDPSRTLVWFRRNQVRGTPKRPGIIAQGSAGHGAHASGGITWSDGAVLNASTFNTDTGRLRHLVFTNNLGLDIYSVGSLGTHSTRGPFMTDYEISGNSYRLGWILSAPTYRRHAQVAGPDGRTRLTSGRQVPLGRWVFPEACGLKVQGIAEDIRFTRNWFTTRSLEEMGAYTPLFPRDPEFRLVYRMPERDLSVTNAPSVFRADALEVDLSGNRISSVPLDFERMQALDGGRVARLSEGASPLLNRRKALPQAGGFAPLGGVERVEMVFTNVSRRIPWKGLPFGVTNGPPQEGETVGMDRVLIGGIEVLCGRPDSGGGGQFRLPVRVALQPTPLAGLPGTLPLAGRPVFLEVLPGSRNPRRLSAVTGPDGVATFTWEVPPDLHGVDYFRVWTDGGQGRAGEWDEFQDAWSTAHHAHGRTVAVEVERAAADGVADLPGLFRLIRSGPDDRPLTVRLEVKGGEKSAVRGTDFQLTGAKGARYPGAPERSQGEIGNTVEFARGQREMTLDVTALPGTARNGRLVTVVVTPGDGYAPGEPPQGDVVVYAGGESDPRR
ncbi:MAG: hypothetical protein J0L84_04065 [Verrucomicrobia bacterium]|nr:hypothetical protein [Verrucomicrobiota bacterium]